MFHSIFKESILIRFTLFMCTISHVNQLLNFACHEKFVIAVKSNSFSGKNSLIIILFVAVKNFSNLASTELAKLHQSNCKKPGTHE